MGAVKGGAAVVQREVSLKPEKSGIYLITKKVYAEVPELSEVQLGVANLFLQSTDAAITVNENADPTVRSDMEGALERIVQRCPSAGPEQAPWGKTSLVGSSLDIPIHNGKFALGTWQGLYLCDWLGQSAEGHKLIVTIQPVADVAAGTKAVTLKAPSRGCHLVTDELEAALPALRACDQGTVNLHILHTSASLTINENADPTVRSDMEGALNRIAPEAWNSEFFEHTMEGPDDMPAHVKSTLVGPALSLPVRRGQLALGTWQGIYLNEHRDCGGFGGGHQRKIILTLHPDQTCSQSTTTVAAPSRGCHDITDQIVAAAPEIAGCRAGTCHLFIRHTSASLTVGPKAPEAGAFLEDLLNSVVPEKWNSEFFEHTYEGPDDMPAHVKSTLMGASLTIPIADGRLRLGPEQVLMLCEHRNTGGWGGGLRREIVITIHADPL